MIYKWLKNRNWWQIQGLQVMRRWKTSRNEFKICNSTVKKTQRNLLGTTWKRSWIITPWKRHCATYERFRKWDKQYQRNDSLIDGTTSAKQSSAEQSSAKQRNWNQQTTKDSQEELQVLMDNNRKMNNRRARIKNWRSYKIIGHKQIQTRVLVVNIVDGMDLLWV